jgi:hypothetical protein
LQDGQFVLELLRAQLPTGGPDSFSVEGEGVKASLSGGIGFAGVGAECGLGVILVVALAEVLGKLDLVFFFEFDVVLDEVEGAFFWLFAALFVAVTEFGFVEESHLDDARVVDHLLVLVKVHLLEVGTVLVGRGDV